MTLPTDAKARKDVPLYSGLLKYFPDALADVAELSRIGNDQHNPGQPLHWDRSKSTDELDALTRHLMEAGTTDTDGVRHSTKVAWRSLSNLQKEIERDNETRRNEARAASSVSVSPNVTGDHAANGQRSATDRSSCSNRGFSPPYST